MNTTKPSLLCNFIALVVFLSATAVAQDTLCIVENGAPRALVHVAQADDKQVNAAADTLIRYVAEASGATLVKYTVRPDTAPAAIELRVDATLKDMDGDGYVIDVTPKGITISGPTAWGVEFGVYEFLERYVGVRWLLPGPDGDDVPQNKTLTVPLGTVEGEPAYFTRDIPAMNREWGRRNRLHARVKFHHWLLRLFPPSKYTKTHPEFFPMRADGKRFLPPTDKTNGWQPCFSNSETVTEAVKNITAYFKVHPEATSYSLGTNDSSGFCLCPECSARMGKERNYVGHRNFSNLYYDWCNRVVEGVLAEYPDKYFGCLGYYDVSEAPTTVKLHPRLISYLTYDRSQYAYAPLKEKDEAVAKAWRDRCTAIGWYDYIYGATYCLPRVYFHTMDDYLRFGRDNNVRAFYAEAYTNWGSGPKMYVVLKLLWDPDRDVDALLKEWYERAVGVKAAPCMAAYYALWEDFWTRRIHEHRWFPKQGRTYLAFDNPSYLEAVTAEDMRKSRAWLEEAVAKAGTEKQRTRARLMLRAFEYYEASWQAFSRDAAGEQLPLVTEADALRIADFAEQTFVCNKKRLDMITEFASDPVLRFAMDLRHPSYAQVRGDAWGVKTLWRTVDWVEESPVVRARLDDMAARGATPIARATAQGVLTYLATAKTQSVTANPSCETGEGAAAEGWQYWTARGIGSIARSSAAART
ncbi:MAG: DUF4838 domain-containing protein, partial [Lentisphaeria bacterium]|nr:DUF4838 domain-containing protein [Lentisphaeria bacterium]